MAVPRSGRPATYEDLLAVPEHLVAEIIDDELYTSPRPAPRHASATAGLSGALHGPFDRGRRGPVGWRILMEPELHFGRDVLVPDLAGWRRDRLPELPQEAYFTLAPDWVCEVLSPSTASLDRLKKLRVYAREQVRCVWLVDPIATTVEVFGLEAGQWVLTFTAGGAETIPLPPFDVLPLDLTLLWEVPEPEK